MEKWSNGRESRLSRFEEFFNANEDAIALELKGRLVDVEELKSLREKAAQYDELKEELVRSTDERRRLKESNDRISEELCARLSSRKKDFDQEHKELLKELEGYKQQLQDSKELTKNRDTDRVSRTTPVADGRSSPAPFATGESRGIPRAIHNEMVKKYNDQIERVSDLKAAHSTLATRVRELKQQLKDWAELNEKSTNSIERKTEKISRQTEEIQRLRTRVAELESIAQTRSIADGENSIRPSHYFQRDAQGLLSEMSRGPALSAPPELTSDSGRSSDLSNVITKNPIFLPPQYDIPGERADSTSVPQTTSSAVSGHAREHNGIILPTSPEQTLPQAPRIPGREETQIVSTQFVGLEPESHPASDITEGSTEGSSPSLPIDKPAGPAQDSQAQESPETPVVISSRRVKRKRTKDIAASPIMSRVKTEILSSSPIGVSTFENMRFNESMDLDDIGEKIDTPKKKRQFEIFRQISGLSNVTSGNDSNDYADDVRIEIANAPNDMLPKSISALQPLSPNRKILPRTSETKQPKKRRANDGRSIRSVAEDTNTQNATKPSANNTAHEREDEASKLTNLMEFPSPEKQVLRPSRAAFPNKPFTPGVTSGFRGELLPATSTGARLMRSSRELPATSLTDPGRSRLRSSSPDKNNAYDLNSPSLRAKEAPKATEVRGRSSLSAQRPNTKSNTNSTPFRRLPLASLGVEHFKVNPAYNSGYDFAFKDVVRGQEQRRELQGCIKPECCGTKFRVLALELYREPQDSEARNNEEKIIKDYLGDTSWKLKGMLQEERKETMILAMTRNLSNKFGRHRHAFSRSKTPPGFWNTDFPTTQEQEGIREQQQQHQRDLVELRYKEAMRSGGAYMFRDE